MNSYRQTHRLRDQIYGYQGKQWEGEIDGEFGMDTYTLLYFKWVTRTYYTTQGALLNIM